MITIDSIRNKHRKLTEALDDPKVSIESYHRLKDEWDKVSDDYVQILLARIDELNHIALRGHGR